MSPDHSVARRDHDSYGLHLIRLLCRPALSSLMRTRHARDTISLGLYPQGVLNPRTPIQSRAHPEVQRVRRLHPLAMAAMMQSSVLGKQLTAARPVRRVQVGPRIAVRESLCRKSRYVRPQPLQIATDRGFAISPSALPGFRRCSGPWWRPRRRPARASSRRLHGCPAASGQSIWTAGAFTFIAQKAVPAPEPPPCAWHPPSSGP